MSRDMMGVQEVSPGYEFVAGSPAVPLGYKQTDVGVIPEDWEIFPFGEHFSIYAGGDAPKHSLSSTQSDRHPYPVFANAIQGKGLYGFTAETRSKPDSVTVTARGYLGHAEYRSEPFFPIVRLLVLEPKGTLDSKYTSYAINDRVQFSIESTGVPQLTAPQVARYAVAAPSDVKEQKAIAVALSDVDALLEDLDRLIAKKRDIKQAAMQQLLTGETRLPGFGGNWGEKHFTEIFERINIKNHQIQTSHYQDSGSYPVIDQGKELIVGFSDQSDCLFECPAGGVIVFGDHTCIVKFVDFNFVVGADGTQVIKAKSGHVTRFYAHHMKYRGVEQTGYNRHFRHLLDRRFVVPSFDEQVAISNTLSYMDTEIQALEQRRSKTAELKQGMMQELLTGRTRLV